MNESHNHNLKSSPYTHTPDSSLMEQIDRARNGSREALLTLQAVYRPLTDSLLATYSQGMNDQERTDMREEAERAFLRAVARYDTAAPRISFGAYAKICMRNGLISARNELYELRHESLVAYPEEELADDDDIAADLAEEESFRNLCRVVRGHLSDFENRVWWQYVTGVSVADIAKELGRDERSVHNAIYRIRKKLRARLTTRVGDSPLG